MKPLFITVIVVAFSPILLATSANAQSASAATLTVAQGAGNHVSWQSDRFATATNYPSNLAVNELRDDPASDFPRGQANSSDSGAPGLTRLSAR